MCRNDGRRLWGSHIVTCVGSLLKDLLSQGQHLDSPAMCDTLNVCICLVIKFYLCVPEYPRFTHSIYICTGAINVAITTMSAMTFSKRIVFKQKKCALKCYFVVVLTVWKKTQCPRNDRICRGSNENGCGCFSHLLQTSIVSQLLRHGANPTLLNCNQDKPSGNTFKYSHTHTHENCCKNGGMCFSKR